MFTTAILILVFANALVIQVYLWLLMLRLGARWAKIPAVTVGRALLVTLIVFISQTGFAVASLIYVPKTPLQGILGGMLALGVAIGLPVALILIILQASWWQAFRAWLPTLLVNLFGFLLALLVIRPFLFEGFQAVANSMAPTILGQHVTDVCPTCGKPAFGSPPSRDHAFPDGQPMICEQFHVHPSTTASPLDKEDRFLVMKTLRPRRWDLIAFRFPGDPTINYVKRLVGLPGEEVFIKDGALWIDGQRLEPPPALQGLTYVTKFPGSYQPYLWGTPDHPAKLGAGEYFVLGDFSQQSADSRLWASGAPGHPSFAVPESHIIGVATHIYWPPGRWRILR